jgi:hypothetical protein
MYVTLGNDTVVRDVQPAHTHMSVASGKDTEARAVQLTKRTSIAFGADTSARDVHHENQTEVT